MKLSVITVSYNSGATIADTLRSVSEQTHPDIEHIIVDGGSTDGTLALVKQHGLRVTTLVSEKDRGIYDAMNKGLALATGDLVGFLNSDDVFADTQVLERIAAVFRDQSIELVYGDIVFVAQQDLSKVVRLWTSRPYRAGLCSTGWMPPHPSLYVRQRVYQQHGGYDLAFPAAADFEMALRLLDRAGLRCTYIPAVQVRMRMGGQSTRSLRNILSGSREVSAACRKHGLPGGIRFALKRLLAKVPQLFRRPDSIRTRTELIRK